VEDWGGSCLLGHFDGPVVVAVVAVWVVKVTADQVVDVLAVRDRLVAAVRSVLVFVLVFGAVMAGRAVGGVGLADRQCVALDAAPAVVVQLAIDVIRARGWHVTHSWTSSQSRGSKATPSPAHAQHRPTQADPDDRSV
jgi:hypothetical protein